MFSIDVFHFGKIATGNDSRLHAMFTQVQNKRFKPLDVIIRHVALKLIQLSGYFLLNLFHPMKQTVVYLYQSLTFD